MFKLFSRYLKIFEIHSKEIISFSSQSHRSIAKIVFPLFLLVSAVFFVSISLALLFGKLQYWQPDIYIVPVFITILMYLLYLNNFYSYFLYCAVTLLLLVSATCLWAWGVHHFVGIIFMSLFLMLVITILPFKVSLTISVMTLLLVLALGISQSVKAVEYQLWNTAVSPIDSFVVVSVFFVFISIVFMFQISYVRKLDDIDSLNRKLVKHNSELQQRVIQQTVKVLQNRLVLDESEIVLHDAFAKLTKSEKDRFMQMNRLASLALLIGRKVHDIKSPLMYLGNMFETLPAEQVKSIIKQIGLELDYISNYSRCSEEKIEIVILDIIKESIEILKWKSLDKIIYDIQYDSSFMNLVGPRNKFLQIVTNLLDNAIDSALMKTSAYIKISITCSSSVIKIDISDPGNPVPVNYRKKIFQEFFTTKTSGTGLGLYICKKYLREIWSGTVLYNRLKGLNIFTISIPLAPPN